MDDQTTIKNAGPTDREHSPSMHGPSTRREVASFAHHALELSELQFQLLVTDLQAATRSSQKALFLLLFATVVLIAAVPVLLLAVAEWLQLRYDWSSPVSLLVTGVVALLLSGALLGMGIAAFRRGAGKLARSREEFRQNLRWAKEMLAPTSPTQFPAAAPPSPRVDQPAPQR